MVNSNELKTMVMEKIIYNSVISFLVIMMVTMLLPSLYKYILEYYFILLLVVNSVFVVRLYRDTKVRQ